jgi:hypothetical protein
MRESNPNSEFMWRNWGDDADSALWGLRFREARISRLMADAQSGFAAANLADIKNRMSVPAANLGNKARMSMKTKDKVKKVEKSRSQRVEERITRGGLQPSGVSRMAMGFLTFQLLDSSTARLQNSGNKARMSMKTKGNDKMSAGLRCAISTSARTV